MPTVPSMVSQQLGLLSTGADPADVRDGQSFIKPGSLAIQAGSMPDNGDLGTIVPGTENIDIPLGYTSGGVVQGDENLVATNIKAGVDLFGVTGTAVLAEGNATPEQVLDGVTYSTGTGANVGTMPNNGSLGTIIPDTTNQNIPPGYTSGGTVAGSANLISSNIRNGTSIFGVAGNVIQSTGTATPDKLLLGETASNASGAITGTMPNNGSLGTITPGTSNQSIPAGYTSGGTVSGSGNLQPGNIRLGVNMFGVTGTLDPGTQTGGSAQPAQVLTGQTFTNDNGVQTGTMPNNGAIGTITPGISNQSIPSGYTSGGTVLGDTDLIPENIKSGISLFGVSGTLTNTVITGQTEETLVYAETIAANDPVYMNTSATSLSSISAYPTIPTNAVAMSYDGVYLAVVGNASPYISLYKRTGDTFTKLANPATLPVADSRGVTFSRDGVYLVVGHFTTPFMTIYKRSGDTFTKLSDPAILPPGTVLGSAFSDDGTYFVASSASTPFIAIYKRSGDTFTKLSNPSTTPSSSTRSVSFSSDGTYLALTMSSSPFMTIYKRSGDTFTKLADPAILPTGAGYGVDFSDDGKYLAVSHDVFPYMTIYARSGDTFTKIANPAELPSGLAISSTFAPNNYLCITSSASPYILIYKEFGSNVFTKIPVLASIPTSSVNSSSFSGDGMYLAGGQGAGNNLILYKFIYDQVFKSTGLMSDFIPIKTGAGYALESGTVGQSKKIIRVWR